MSVTSTPALLFQWAPPRGRSLSLIGFVAGSAMLHALAFYLFQILYPANVSLLPPPAHVALIAPTVEENRTLLRWVDAEDPALASATLRPPDSRVRALPNVPHIPSYVTEQPRLKPIPPIESSIRAPDSQPPGPVPTTYGRPAFPTLHAATKVLFSEEIAALGDAQLPAMHFTTSPNEAPQSVSFRIGVSPTGELRYCFPINSSGDPSLDEQARRQLLLARFPPSAVSPGAPDQSLRWGRAIFEWGNDVASPAPAVPPTAKP